MHDGERYDQPEVSVRPPILTVIVFPDSGCYVAKCIELDLITEMDTPQEAVRGMVEMLKEYAEDYHTRKEAFSRSPNRAHHKPYVDALLACKTDWEVYESLEIRHGHLHVRPTPASVA